MGKNNRLFYNIVLFADGLPFEWNQFEVKALGGSETSALASAKALAKKGHSVTLFCRCEQQGLKPDGVFYRKIGEQPGDYSNFLNYCMTVPIDILILQRIPQMLQTRMNTKLNILWMHDLAWKQQAQTFRGVLHNVDEVWVSNKFAKKQMQNVYGGPDELYYDTPQGILQNYWEREDFQNIPKEHNRIMYCARPERGLDILLFQIMPKLIKRVPDVKLYLAGYGDIPEHLRPLYELCQRQMEVLRDNVINLGGLSKPDLYKELMKSQAYVYPTAFEETFCLTAVECQRSGTPFITTAGIGALPETLNTAGNIFVDVEEEPEPTKKVKHPKYADAYVDAVVDFLNKPEKAKQEQRNIIIKFSKDFTWDKATNLWIDRIDKIFKERTADKYKLARHFYKANDIMVAKELSERIGDVELLNKIKLNYAYLNTLDSNRKYYEQQAVDVEGLKRTVVATEKTPRVISVINYIKNNPDIKNVLDYGCGEGTLSYPIANIGPDMKVRGCDIAHPRLDIAVSMIQRSKYNNVTFKLIEAEIGKFASKHHEKYDAIVLGEVLEHIEKPAPFLNLLEKHFLKDGGHIILTTPHNEWNQNRPLATKAVEQEDLRNHIHNFSKHDFDEMFALKRDYEVSFIPLGRFSDDPSKIVSASLVTYRVNGKPTCEINYDRKFTIQAPSPLISACLIAKNNEDTILKCLKSIDPVADEIIIADTGSTDKTVQIAKDFSVKVTVIDGSNPLQLSAQVIDGEDEGFSRARNESIRNAKGDWILWIDTDETLVGARNLFKYLRFNHFNGFSIQQHHHTVSPPNAFAPDLPVRIFRNNGKIKFYGVVHEHPELGINKSVGYSIGLSDVNISHPAYLTEDVRRLRFMRNFPLVKRDREKHPERVLGKFMWIRDLIHWSRYHIERNKNQMTQEAFNNCNEVIRMVRSDFLDPTQNTFVSTEIINYYSEACTILNIGFDADFYVQTSKRNPQKVQSAAKRIRFATVKDYQKFMNAVVERSSEGIEDKYNL